MQGFCFALLQYSHIQAFTARFATSIQLYHPRHKTAHRALQGRFRPFSLFCRSYVAGASAYTAPSAPRWSVSQRLHGIHRYQIPAQRRTPYRSAQPQTIPARRGQLLPCVDRWKMLRPAHLLSGQRIHLYMVSPAGSRCFPRPAACSLAPGQPGTLHPAGQSSSRDAAGGTEPLAALAASLFGLSPDS